MSIFSYHLLKTSWLSGCRYQVTDPIGRSTPGLIHAEVMSAMTLGAPILSPARVLLGTMAVFIQWENPEALEAYLDNDPFGRTLAEGWHVRLSFARVWGGFTGFVLPARQALLTEDDTVVAVTIARMRPLAVPRFISWGRPVEKLVRDHPATMLSLASVRFPNTVSTFSIWESVREMSEMVHGRSKVPRPRRHAEAMQERNRKPFHFEFTTLRFKPLSEHGSWKGRNDYLPGP